MDKMGFLIVSDRGQWALPDAFYRMKKILFLAGVIAHSRLEFTYNYTMRDFPKMLFFVTKNLSSSTFFEIRPWNFVVMFTKLFRRIWMQEILISHSGAALLPIMCFFKILEFFWPWQKAHNCQQCGPWVRYQNFLHSDSSKYFV